MSSPNWIFPLDSFQFDVTANTSDFQSLMYRPLYWFGNGSSPALDPSFSLAKAPTYDSSGTKVTIVLKRWRWSNNTVVDAQSVMFWMNLVRAEKNMWAGYVPGEMPDNVVAVSASSPSSSSITITMNRSYNPTWLLYNELSTITPLPEAWDINHLVNRRPAPPGSGGCSAMDYNQTVAGDCQKVWKFLTDDNGQSSSPHEAGDVATYATNPLWQVVDGPWHLTSFSSYGKVVMQRNPHYSGPANSSVSRFIEVPFDSATSEYYELESLTLDVGYLPLAYARPATTSHSVGPNPTAIAGDYSAALQPMWMINFAPINLHSNADSGAVGAIFSQTYIRQALERLIDQPMMIKKALKGYGTAGLGPVPAWPRNSFVSSYEKSAPFSYSVSAAESLLRTHGWTIVPGGVDTCSVPSECGAGIPSGAKLAFQEVYAAGAPGIGAIVRIQKADAAKAGVAISLAAEPISTVISEATPCNESDSSCSWQALDWGGWIYTPDIYPTGEQLFQTGSSSNYGSYSSSENDQLISETIDSVSSSAFVQWENYLTSQAPVIWLPVQLPISEARKSLGGYEPSVLLDLTPETWFFKK